MDELTARLGGAFAVSEDNIYGDHPHFADYKNEGRISRNQRQRREEYMQRQYNKRDEYLYRIRSMYDGMRVEDMEIEPTVKQNGQILKFKGDLQEGFENMDFTRWGISDVKGPNGASVEKARKKKNRVEPTYADTLMFSEWLVDIPCQLDTEWVMVSCPVGKRCLLVATKGVTCVYNKTGYRLAVFQSDFPGGNRADPVSFTMLDCIMDKTNKKYYVLDLICWDGEQFTEKDFTARRAILMESFGQMPQLADPGPEDAPARYTFFLLEACECTVEAMTAFMRNDFSYTCMDGLLFYYSKALYRPGQTPLVGWLKPWMLPEILGVEVPMKYICEQGFYTSTQHFINRFNEKHRFKSSIVKPSVDDGGETNGGAIPAAQMKATDDGIGANSEMNAVKNNNSYNQTEEVQQ